VFSGICLSDFSLFVWTVENMSPRVNNERGRQFILRPLCSGGDESIEGNTGSMIDFLRRSKRLYGESKKSGICSTKKSNSVWNSRINFAIDILSFCRFCELIELNNPLIEDEWVRGRLDDGTFGDIGSALAEGAENDEK